MLIVCYSEMYVYQSYFMFLNDLFLFLFFWVAAHYSILAWKMPWIQESGGLQSMASQRVRYHLVTKHMCLCVYLSFHYSVTDIQSYYCYFGLVFKFELEFHHIGSLSICPSFHQHYLHSSVCDIHFIFPHPPCLLLFSIPAITVPVTMWLLTALPLPSRHQSEDLKE